MKPGDGTAAKRPTSPEPMAVRPGNPGHQATAATERIPHHLARSDDEAAQGQLAALGGALDLLPLTAPTAARAELERAVVAFESATRSRIAADHTSARVLRRSVQAIWKDPAQHGDDAGLTMLLDVALTAVAYAMHWHRTRQPAQQQAAAEQTLIHLQTSYAQIAAGPPPGGQPDRRSAGAADHRVDQGRRVPLCAMASTSSGTGPLRQPGPDSEA